MFCTGSPFGPKTEPEVVMFEYRPEKPEQPVRMAAASNRSVVTFFIIFPFFRLRFELFQIRLQSYYFFLNCANF